MARFAQYAMAATEEALEDAGWRPGVGDVEEREMTVRLFLRWLAWEWLISSRESVLDRGLGILMRFMIPWLLMIGG